MTLVQLAKKNNLTRPFAGRSIFSDFFNDFLGEDMTPEMYYRSVPAVNISESENDFNVELAVPGMKKSDFQITVENGALTIRAERKEEKESNDKRYTRKEFSYSSFSRTFTMPENIDPEKIEASYEDGVLALRLPKMEDGSKKKAKEIRVN